MATRRDSGRRRFLRAPCRRRWPNVGNTAAGTYQLLMDLIDTHCHLDVAAFDADREDVLAACRANGGNRIVIPGVDAAAGGRILDLCASAPGLYPTLGLHPVYLDQHRAEQVVQLGDWLAQHHPKAENENVQQKKK